MKRSILFLAALFGCCAVSYAQQLLSPDGNLKMTLKLE